MLFENVPDFAKAQGGGLLIALKEELRGRGYSFHPQVLEAWKYRVPPVSVAGCSLLGSRAVENSSGPNRVRKRPTVRDAIGDLPVVSGGNRNEVQNYEGSPASTLAKSLRRDLRGGEARGDS